MEAPVSHVTRRLRMKRTAWLMTAVAAALIAAVSVAQTRPDFTGRWTSEPVPAAPGAAGGRQTGGPVRGGGAPYGDLGSGWGSNIAITQDARLLTVEYAFFARGDMQPPLKFVYALDGSEAKNSVMMGRGVQVQASKAKWDADVLVITTVHTFSHPETGQVVTSEVRQRLSLEMPTSLIVETTRSGVLGGPPSTTRTVYRKVG
jgi:hypothetical protein